LSTASAEDWRPSGRISRSVSPSAALGEAQIQRTRLRNEGLEGFEFTIEQRTDAKMAMAVLAGSSLSLTQAAKIAMEFHGIRTSGIALNDAVAALLKTKSKRSERYKKDLRLGAWRRNSAADQREIIFCVYVCIDLFIYVVLIVRSLRNEGSPPRELIGAR
jgi:hypothetical protein